MRNFQDTFETDVKQITSLMTESLSYGNQSIDLLFKSVDWFLYDNGLRHERVNYILKNR